MYNYQKSSDIPLNRVGYEINITGYTINIILGQLLFTAVLLCRKGRYEAQTGSTNYEILDFKGYGSPQIIIAQFFKGHQILPEKYAFNKAGQIGIGLEKDCLFSG